MPRIRVLIVDDEALVRHALRIFISADDDMEVVGEAFDGVQAVDQAARLRPDVVLMDLQMPRMNGIEATEKISTRFPETRVLAVTTFSSERRVVAALRAGASGYLVKDTEPDDILTAIRDVHGGRSVMSPRVTRELILSLQDQPVTPRTSARTVEPLTERELSIVKLIATGLSNAEIARRLQLAEPTVKASLSRVIGKWGVRDRVQVLIYAVSNDIVSIRPDDLPGEGARPR